MGVRRPLSCDLNAPGAPKGAPTEEEFFLYHTEGVEASGFVENVDLNIANDFRPLMQNGVIQVRKNRQTSAPTTSRAE